MKKEIAKDNLPSPLDQINARLERMESILVDICKCLPAYNEDLEVLRYKEVIRQGALGDPKPLQKYLKAGGKVYRGIDI